MSDLDRDGDYDFTRVLDHSARTLGRPTGWDLLDEVGTAENGAVYGYDAATGRLATVAGASAGTFSYAYTADSGLLESVTRQHPDGTLLRNIRTYDSTRDTLATISNRVLVPNGQNGFDTTVRSSYDYAAVNGGVNSIGQRKGVRTTFNPDGTVASKDISWEYDALGQVTSADGPATVADRSYQYDAIGNRIMSSADQSTTDYEADYMPGANFLNQYDTIHTPGDTWFLSHDDDGNLTYGPVPGYPSTDPAPSEPVRGWFVWDAENRLIDATADQYLYYAGTTRRYDPLGRLIWETGGGTGAPGTIYVYDGWNRIAQYALTWDVSTMAPAAALTHTYLWGPDLSGAFQGAGGVGGLLAVNRVSSTMAYPTFDGNGNITEYLDATGGVLAHFEYDPFGNTVVSTDYDNSFAYRFSTKPIDQATGWYYYGYRWYDPLTGRWPSRDPIEEQGGVNLYGLVKNDPICRYDILGMHEDAITSHKVSKCEIYIYIGHSIGGGEMKWDVPKDNTCYYAYALACHPFTANLGLPKEVLPPDIPLHDNNLYWSKEMAETTEDGLDAHLGTLVENMLASKTKNKNTMVSRLCDPSGCCCDKVTLRIKILHDTKPKKDLNEKDRPFDGVATWLNNNGYGGGSNGMWSRYEAEKEFVIEYTCAEYNAGKGTGRFK